MVSSPRISDSSEMLLLTLCTGQNEDDDVVVGSEGYAESDILSGENLDKSLELKASAKIDQDETPGVRSNQKRGDVALNLQKMEMPRNQKEEISIQKTYSRRSTRLSEKKMMELNLNDEEGMEPIDFGVSDKEMDNEIEVSGKEYSDDFGRISDIQGMPIYLFAFSLHFYPIEACGAFYLLLPPCAFLLPPCLPWIFLSVTHAMDPFNRMGSSLNSFLFTYFRKY